MHMMAERAAVTFNRPVPPLMGKHITGVCVCVCAHPDVAGLGGKGVKCFQNQVSRCHTHSGTGNWHNVR